MANMLKVISLTPCAFFLALAVAVVAPVSPSFAQEVIAVIQQAKGTVQIERSGVRQDAATGSGLQVSDIVHTGPNAAVGLEFTDGALVALGPGTEYALESYQYDKAQDRGSFDSSIRRGSLSVRSGRIAKKGTDRMRIRTPATILGVRGTRFMVRVDPDN
ncbi:FecR family protein [Minwuia sp.]|uniref:FecR family protein n=1 Tax=Minwuia sp. TaxID=2493630 RepID=UPI003A945B80